jgi:hypothetical protein
MTTATAEEIRQFVDIAYFKPARRGAKRQVTVVALDVHNDMKLDSRMPAVCSALDAKLVAAKYGVSLVKRSGPRQSSTATWLFEVKK